MIKIIIDLNMPDVGWKTFYSWPKHVRQLIKLMIKII
jgi:hypothetical protein